jgi:hypothetical protein
MEWPLGLPFSFTKSGKSQVGVDPRPLYNLMGDPQYHAKTIDLRLVFLGWGHFPKYGGKDEAIAKFSPHIHIGNV